MGIDLGSIMDTNSIVGSIRSSNNKPPLLQRGESHNGGESNAKDDEEDFEDNEIDGNDNDKDESQHLMIKKKKKIKENCPNNYLTTNLDVIGAISAVSLHVSIFTGICGSAVLI